MRDAAEVQADSLFEAIVLAVKILRTSPCSTSSARQRYSTSRCATRRHIRLACSRLALARWRSEERGRIRQEREPAAVAIARSYFTAKHATHPTSGVIVK